MRRPIFSGHETFRCKTHWLKRGYDFICNSGNFNAEEAVVQLGVGKNMVASIKYWMKAFGLIDVDSQNSDLAVYLLDDETGKDPFFEDLGTLWLLHFLLINEDHATLYRKTFVDFHRRVNEFEKSKLQNYIKAIYSEGAYAKTYNEATVKKDINVLFSNYSEHKKESAEEKNTLLLPLNLIKEAPDKDCWVFNRINQETIPAEIFLFAIVKTNKDESNSISFDLLQELALIFCIDNNDLLRIVYRICALYPNKIIFSDNSGIKELQFRQTFTWMEILTSYYEKKS